MRSGAKSDESHALGFPPGLGRLTRIFRSHSGPLAGTAGCPSVFRLFRPGMGWLVIIRVGLALIVDIGQWIPVLALGLAGAWRLVVGGE